MLRRCQRLRRSRHDEDDDGVTTATLMRSSKTFSTFCARPARRRCRIIGAYASADGTEAWAATLAAELGLSSGLIRVKRLRIEKKIRREMQKRGTCPDGIGPLTWGGERPCWTTRKTSGSTT